MHPLCRTLVALALLPAVRGLAQPPRAEALPPPEWARGAVWYQVFPERFDNGNPANDPATPGAFNPGWTSDFYATTTRELESARAAAVAWGRAGWTFSARTAVGQAIPYRRYGGDLQGVVRRLDHLRDLGVTVVYFSPVFQARSEHKYETSDHRHVDESLGNAGPARAVWTPDPLETADPATWRWTDADRYLLDVLLPEARARGLRVVLDGVWNHVGTQHWAFRDVLRQGRSSPYAGWFKVRFNEDGSVRSWTGWPDRANGDLPEFAQTAEGDLVPEVKAHIFAVTRRWMDPNGDGDPRDGIDGWRLDVVPDVGIPFWRDWHALVKSINPEAVTIAEIWTPATRWIEAGCFDGQMNYPLAMPLVEWLRGGRDAAWLRGRINAVFRPGEGLDAHDLSHMNLLGGHDTERIASMIENPGPEYDQGRGVLRGPEGYNAGRASAGTYDLVEVAYAILAALPGSPMVFQGDEWGMVGGDDPECRKPVAWPDAGVYASTDDAPLPEFPKRIGRWLRLRGEAGFSDPLRFGALRLHDAGHPDVLVVERLGAEGSVLLVANRGATSFDATGVLDGAGWGPAEEAAVAARGARVWQRPRVP